MAKKISELNPATGNLNGTELLETSQVVAGVPTTFSVPHNQCRYVVNGQVSSFGESFEFAVVIPKASIDACVVDSYNTIYSAAFKVIISIHDGQLGNNASTSAQVIYKSSAYNNGTALYVGSGDMFTSTPVTLPHFATAPASGVMAITPYDVYFTLGDDCEFKFQVSNYPGNTLYYNIVFEFSLATEMLG